MKSLAEFLEWDPPYHANIVADGIITPGSRMMIFGGPKAWKSGLLLDLCFCLANGTKWLGFDTIPCVVYKFQVELPEAMDQLRMKKYRDHLPVDQADPTNLYFETRSLFKLDNGPGYKLLESDLQILHSRYPQARIVLVLDPLYRMVSGDMSKELDAKRFMDNIDLLLGKFPLSVVVAHHARKSHLLPSGGTVDMGEEESTGTRHWAGWVDTMLRSKLLNPAGGKNKVRLDFLLTRNAPRLLPYFELTWSRETLHPVINLEDLPMDDPDIRDLKGGTDE